MKEVKSSSIEGSRTAEDWVNLAKEFGEKCVAIQQDPHLDLEQKLAKQKDLSKQIATDIQNDPNLAQQDKTIMLNSLKNYIDDWMKMHEALKLGSSKR